MREFKYLASLKIIKFITIFNDSPFAKMITGFINLLPFGGSSLFTGEII